MPFSILEKDEKTFSYFKQYVEYLEQTGNTCLILDNKIQTVEIQDHLKTLGLNGDSPEGEKKQEISRWIKDNARPFRDYLNSIKLAYVVWKGLGKEWKDMTWEEFVRIEELLNNLKYCCLDTIF